MSLYNNNLNDMLLYKKWNDMIYELESDKTIVDNHNQKYTDSQNISNDTRSTLMQGYKLHKEGNLPKYYYDDLFLRQTNQPFIKDKYNEPLIEGRDTSLFDTLNKQPIVVSSYIVDNKAVKRYASAISDSQKPVKSN